MSVVQVTCPHCGWTTTVATNPHATAPRFQCRNPGCRQITPLPGGWISQ